MAFAMDARQVTRWSAMALVLGGILYVVHSLTHPLGETSQYVRSSVWVPAHEIGYIASILMLFGFIGLYSRFAEKTGRLGLVGFILTLIGSTTSGAAVLWVGAFVQPFLVSNSPSLNDSLVSLSSPAAPFFALVAVMLLVGYAMFSVALYRTKVFPRWVVWLAAMSIIAIPITLGAVAVIALANIGGIVVGLSVAGWGYALWSSVHSST